MFHPDQWRLRWNVGRAWLSRAGEVGALRASCVIACLLSQVFLSAHAGANPLSILATSDTEGHVGPCRNCPLHAGDGGLARRAALVADCRKSGPVLLLDAGNALFGTESLDSRGKVIAVAYDAIGYDAINISHRDFRLGKAATLAALAGANPPAVSANLVDADSGKPLFSPYVVKAVGGSRYAVIGLTEPPPGLEMLPGLQRQLAGVRIAPPLDALDQWLPKAKADSDAVILLYYGSAAGVRSVQEKHAVDLLLVVAGGIRSDPGFAATPPVLLSEEHGKSLGRAAISEGPGRVPALSQLPVESRIQPTDELVRLLARYEPPAVAPVTQPVRVRTASALPATVPEPVAVSTTAPAPPAPVKASVPVAAPVMPGKPVATIPPKSPKLPDPMPAKQPANRVAAKQSLAPRGLDGVGLTPGQVNAAIDRGRDFLWKHVQDEHEKHLVKTLVNDGPDLLSALALVHAGAHRKIPEFDAQLRRYLVEFDPRATQLATYEAGLYCMLVEAYGDPIFRPKLRDTARYIVEMQGAGGSWGYGHSLPTEIYGGRSRDKALEVFGGAPLEGANPGVETIARSTPYLKDKDGDNSVSQFALLGLQAAARWHLRASPETWKRNLAAYRDRQCEDGGWDYQKNGAFGYGSMTCAGICGLAINRYQLGEKEPAVDGQVERGLAWLDAHFSVNSNPAQGTYLYYYLYSLERVGRILDTEFIGAHEWYPLGARFLVDAQKANGKWVETIDEVDPRPATSFALLFLTRATATLTPEVARNGSGELRTSLASAPPARLYVILDASGSMLEEMDGRLKFDLARDAVTAMLELLPSRSQAALRVYGHRKRSIEEGSDEDTELLVPMGDYHPAQFAATLKSLRSRGKTPLALSLAQAAQDLGGSEERTTVVLLTDGGEDTIPRRDPVRAAADFGKLPNLTFHVIGFDVNQEDWNAQLRAMAAAAHAQYWPAPKGNDLVRAMRAALLGDPDYFVVLDAAGKEVHRGRFGESKRLPEGKYEFVTVYGGKEFRQIFWVNTEGVTAVTFDAAQVSRDPSALAATPRPASAPAGASRPVSPLVHRFCVHCGKPLAVSAKFCTECGEKVAPEP